MGDHETTTAESVKTPPGVPDWFDEPARRAGAELEVAAAPQGTVAADRTQTATRLLEELRESSAQMVTAVAATSAEYTAHVASADPSSIIEHLNPVTGERYVELTDERGRTLQKRIRAFAEMSYDVRTAVVAIGRATHDLRLINDQATQIGAMTISFDPSLRGPDLARAPEIEQAIEAEEIDR